MVEVERQDMTGAAPRTDALARFAATWCGAGAVVLVADALGGQGDGTFAQVLESLRTLVALGFVALAWASSSPAEPLSVGAALALSFAFLWQATHVALTTFLPDTTVTALASVWLALGQGLLAISLARGARGWSWVAAAVLALSPLAALVPFGDAWPPRVALALGWAAAALLYLRAARHEPSAPAGVEAWRQAASGTRLIALGVFIRVVALVVAFVLAMLVGESANLGLWIALSVVECAALVVVTIGLVRVRRGPTGRRWFTAAAIIALGAAVAGGVTLAAVLVATDTAIALALPLVEVMAAAQTTAVVLAVLGLASFAKHLALHAFAADARGVAQTYLVAHVLGAVMAAWSDAFPIVLVLLTLWQVIALVSAALHLRVVGRAIAAAVPIGLAAEVFGDADEPSHPTREGA